MSEEENNIEETAPNQERLEAAQRMYLSEIMNQLFQSERFQRFFKINYDVHTSIDEENKSFNIRLIELSPESASERLHKLAAEHAEDHMPRVDIATMADIAVVNEISKEEKK